MKIENNHESFETGNNWNSLYFILQKNKSHYLSIAIYLCQFGGKGRRSQRALHKMKKMTLMFSLFCPFFVKMKYFSFYIPLAYFFVILYPSFVKRNHRRSFYNLIYSTINTLIVYKYHSQTRCCPHSFISRSLKQLYA